MPRPASGLSADLPTADVLFLILLPAAVAAAVAGSRVQGRRS
ncbi:hypothetical protein [Streptantibioticus cattleyicolor]|uniref:Uncharacterized protein n=2 Tax=Kitasatosporales TaxID=85011 RepID=G8WVQ0_STREN|nr:hypothetical protein [Streptantibioticus cattleyicolor]AEW97807.1 hypothetical protein SCATT_54360 [Streptantibioticus cattleyicolor NRRL 8057 = DSM 46488]